MHHAIEYQHFSTSTLQVGPRKRSPMGQLLRVTQGAALLKLGAHELLLTPGSHAIRLRSGQGLPGILQCLIPQ